MKKDKEPSAAEVKMIDQALNFEGEQVATYRRLFPVLLGTTITLGVLLAVSILGGVLVWQQMAKPVPPVVLEVDKELNTVRTLDVYNGQRVGNQVLMDKGNAAAYVKKREQFISGIINDDFFTVSAQSEGGALASYQKIFQGEDARHKSLPANTVWKVDIISSSIPRDSQNVAIVRFKKTVITGADVPPMSATFVARLTYRYEKAYNPTERQALASPMGFKVAQYSVDAETAAASEKATPGTQQ